jgi:hypothetical protein
MALVDNFLINCYRSNGLSVKMIRVYQIKGQMFLIIVRISMIYFFS